MKQKTKKNLPTAILILIFFLGLAVMMYPTLANYWNSKTQSRAIVDYESVLQNLKQEDYTAFFAEAALYNEQLSRLNSPFIDYNKLSGYDDILNVGGTGIIGYINIDKIRVHLPVYHGTSEAVLNVAVGHLEGSSLPIGGAGTHAVLSAHRGLPSAKLFSDLDKLEAGDVFSLHVLDRVLYYQIDQILVVEPTEIDELQIKPGEDLCTLFTCTPYGINSHRLLVRGVRVENYSALTPLQVANDVYQLEPLVLIPVVAAPLLLIFFITLLVKYFRRK